jgi:oligosaccharide repeat unit polymerase
MIAAKCVALIFSLGILFNAYVVSRIVGTWLFPATLFACFWFAYTFLPLVALFPVPVEPLSVGFIFAATIVFSASGLVHLRWHHAFQCNQLKPAPEDYFNTGFLRFVFYSAALLSLGAFLLNMKAQGFAVGDMWFDMVKIAGEYADMRYTEELTPSVYSQVNIALAFLTVMIGGVLFGSARNRRQKLLFVAGAFAPALAALLFQSAKGQLFGFIALFSGGVLVTRIFAGRLVLMDRATRRALGWGIVILVPLTALSFMSRGLSDLQDSEVVRDALWHLGASYAFAHLYAFSDWFTHYVGNTSTTRYTTESAGYGFYTFMAFFKAFGDTRHVPLGVYDEFFEYKDLLITNIYTIFRGIITDFGLIGTMVYMFVSGYILHLSYYFLLVRRRPEGSAAMFILTVYYSYASFAISPFIWTTIPVVTLALAICLFVNNRWSSGLAARAQDVASLHAVRAETFKALAPTLSRKP